MRAAPIAAPALLVLLIAAAGGCASPASVREHPELEARLPEIRNVAALTPDMQILRVSADGAREAAIEEMAELAESVPRLVAEALRRRGFSAKIVSVSRTEAEPVYTSYRSAATELFRKKHAFEYESEEEANRASIAATATLARLADADAALLVWIVGETPTVGREIVDGVADGIYVVLFGDEEKVKPPVEVKLSLVHARTGELLWSNRAESEWAQTGVVHALKGLPAAP